MIRRGTIIGLLLVLCGCSQTTARFDPAMEGTWTFGPADEPVGELDIGEGGRVAQWSDPGDDGGWSVVREGTIAIVGDQINLTRSREADGVYEHLETISSYQLVRRYLCFDHCLPFVGDDTLRSRRRLHRSYTERESADGGGRESTEQRLIEEIAFGDDSTCTWTTRTSSRREVDGEVLDDGSWQTESLACTFADDRLLITLQPGEGDERAVELIRFGAGWIEANDEGEIYRRVGDRRP